MNKILLDNQVIIYLVVEFVSLILISIASFYAFLILKKWDFNSFNEVQFKLEQRVFLQSLILNSLLFIKIITLIYFVYTIDALSLLIPGAMCGAGVISANSYGLNLLFIKLLIIFFLMLWLNWHSIDIRAKNYPVIKYKSALLLLIFLLFIIEFYLDISYFTHINVNLPVSCCSALFGQLEGQNPLPFKLNTIMLLTLFYLLFLSTVIFLIYNQHFLNIISSILFLYISYYSVVYFFGTYIYELPTHKCPFCMMQKEYFYIGYFVWGSVFIGSFLSIIYSSSALLFKKEQKSFKKTALYLLSFFVILCSFYVAKYYFINGVFL